MAAMTRRWTESGLPGMCAPAAAELLGNLADVHLVIFGTQADARQFRFNFLKDARDHHRLNITDVVNQAFSFVALGTGAGKVRFSEPEISNLILMRQAKVGVKVFQQTDAREWKRLIHFVANFGEVGPAPDQLRTDVKCAGPGRGVLK